MQHSKVSTVRRSEGSLVKLSVWWTETTYTNIFMDYDKCPLK